MSATAPFPSFPETGSRTSVRTPGEYQRGRAEADAVPALRADKGLPSAPRVSLSRAQRIVSRMGCRFRAAAHHELFDEPTAALLAQIEEAALMRSSVVLNPWLGRPSADSFENIAAHGRAAATAARALCAILLEHSVISRSEALTAVRLAALHDMNKPMELLEREAIAAGVLPAGESHAFERTAERLIAAGIAPQCIEEIKHAGRITSRFGIPQFLTVDNGGLRLRHQRVADMIARLADDMVCSSASLYSEHVLLPPITRFALRGYLDPNLNAQGFERLWLHQNGAFLSCPSNITLLRPSHWLSGEEMSFQILVGLRIAAYLVRLLGAEVENAVEYLHSEMLDRL